MNKVLVRYTDETGEMRQELMAAYSPWPGPYPLVNGEYKMPIRRKYFLDFLDKCNLVDIVYLTPAELKVYRRNVRFQSHLSYVMENIPDITNIDMAINDADKYSRLFPELANVSMRLRLIKAHMNYIFELDNKLMAKYAN